MLLDYIEKQKPSWLILEGDSDIIGEMMEIGSKPFKLLGFFLHVIDVLRLDGGASTTKGGVFILLRIK